MKNDFDLWNEKKKYIETIKQNSLSFNERDIWWCSIGKNIGYEENGKNEFFERPVLVFRKFNNSISWVLPITTKYKQNPYHFLLDNNRSNSVLLSQLRLMSVKRFRRFMGRISAYEFSMLKGQIIDLIKYR